MAFPKLLQRLFDSNGAGTKLNASIMPDTVTHVVGGELGSVELTPSTSASHGGFIDFHWKGSTADYTSRIIEIAQGKLAITAANGLTLNGANVPTGTIPTQTSQLTNNSGYITSSALSSYAKTSAIPTKTSQLTNDSGFLTSSSGGAAGATAYVTASGGTSASWYRKWSTGGVECGGYITGINWSSDSSGDDTYYYIHHTISLPVAMPQAGYISLTRAIGSAYRRSVNMTAFGYDLTTSSFTTGFSSTNWQNAPDNTTIYYYVIGG